MTWSNLVLVFSGLGLFLFGMGFLEEALRETAGGKIKKYLRRFTSTVPRALFTGLFGTAILQSSSVVSLMTISFVGAGLMNLAGAVGVIFGANLGTTVTAWLLMLLGFKFQIESFALPLVGVGSLSLFFLKNPRAKSSAKALIGFGLLFLGLGYMKEATEVLAQTFSLEKALGQNRLVYFGMGIFLTVLLQSSSALTAIILSLLSAGMIDFASGASMVIGTNVGTTVTVILGSLGGTPDKKRVALAHLLFNLFTAIIALALLNYLVFLIGEVFRLKRDAALELVVFHTLFNGMGVLLFSPWIASLVKGLNRLFTSDEDRLVLYLDRVDPYFSVAALAALKQETFHLFERIRVLILKVFGISSENSLLIPKIPEESAGNLKKLPDLDVSGMYGAIKALEAKILSFAAELARQASEGKDVQGVDHVLRAVRELVFAAKSIKDIQRNIEEMAGSDQSYSREIYDKFRVRWAQYFESFSKILSGDSTASSKVLSLHREISQENRSSLENISEAIRARQMDEAMASTTLNADRAVFLASDAIFEAAKLLLLLQREKV